MAAEYTTNALILAHRDLFTEEQERDWFKQFQTTQNQKILTKLVLNFTPIVRRAARELAGYGVEVEDLTSEGLLALTKCVYDFRIDNGNRFAAYALPSVKGAMLGYILKNLFIVNPCTSQKKKHLFFSLRRIISKHLRQFGRFEITSDMAGELAEQFNVQVKDIENMNTMFRQPSISLSAQIYTEGGAEDSNTTFGDNIPSPTPTPEESLAQVESVRYYKAVLEDAMLRVLSERERRIIEMQILAEPEDQLTLHDLSGEFNVSKERIRQIRDSAEKKLAKTLRRRHSDDLLTALR